MMILSLLPWLLYGFVGGSGLTSSETAAIIALIATLIFSLNSLRKKFVLEWCTLIYFFLLSILHFTSLKPWLSQYAFVVSNVVLTLIMWGSIFFKVPFTLQYAREKVDEKFWTSSHFLFINYMISIVWSCALTIMTVVCYLQVQTIVTSNWINLGYVIPFIIAMAFTHFFPKWHSSRTKQASSPNK